MGRAPTHSVVAATLHKTLPQALSQTHTRVHPKIPLATAPVMLTRNQSLGQGLHPKACPVNEQSLIGILVPRYYSPD